MPRRPAAPLLALPLTLALTLGLTACGGSSSPDGPAAADRPVADRPAADAAAVAAVRAAADRSTAATSSRFALTNSIVTQGRPLAITGEGLFDYAGKEGSLALRLPAGTVQQRVVGGKVYLALSQEPKTFYRLSLADVQGTSLGGSTDPTASFSPLRAAAEDVREVGREQVRDAATTHYRGSLDVQKALTAGSGPARQVAKATLGRAGVAQVPFDAWLDREGRLRKYVQAVEVPASEATGGQPVKMTTTVELFDFGVDVQVTAPPATQVKDGAPLLAALRRQTGR